MRSDVGNIRIGGEFGHAFAGGPLCDLRDQRSGNTLLSKRLFNINPFKERHGRRLTTIDVIMPQTCFGEADSNSLRTVGDQAGLMVRRSTPGLLPERFNP